MNADLDKLIRNEFGLGAREAPQAIAHARDPRLPQFEFEWHSGIQKVYRIDTPGEWINGQWVPSAVEAKGYCIAEHVMTHAMFLGHVQTFCRGYLVAVNHHNTGHLAAAAPERITAKGADPCPKR